MGQGQEAHFETIGWQVNPAVENGAEKGREARAEVALELTTGRTPRESLDAISATCVSCHTRYRDFSGQLNIQQASADLLRDVLDR